MPLYRTSGVLTGTIEPENVALADAYLREYDMTQFLDEGLEDIVEHIEWKLESDGHSWHVTAFATAPLTENQLKQLSEWVSGQNSDGLGESFEQQAFAETGGEDVEEDCSACDGSGVFGEGEDGEHGEHECSNCEGAGTVDREQWGMISFDWEKNPCTFTRIK